MQKKELHICSGASGRANTENTDAQNAVQTSRKKDDTLILVRGRLVPRQTNACHSHSTHRSPKKHRVHWHDDDMLYTNARLLENTRYNEAILHKLNALPGHSVLQEGARASVSVFSYRTGTFEPEMCTVVAVHRNTVDVQLDTTDSLTAAGNTLVTVGHDSIALELVE